MMGSLELRMLMANQSGLKMSPQRATLSGFCTLHDPGTQNRYSILCSSPVGQSTARHSMMRGLPEESRGGEARGARSGTDVPLHPLHNGQR